MKVWIAVAGSSLLIVGVWIATFTIPHSNRADTNQQSSELKSILTELRDTMKTGLTEAQRQRDTLSAQNKKFEPPLSNDELTRLANQLTANTHSTTTATGTAPSLTPKKQTKSPTPKLP